MMNASMSSNPCEDLTPVAHNKSDKSNSHQQEDDMNTCTDQSQPAENVRVNLDESKFSINLPAPAKEDTFLTNFTPGTAVLLQKKRVCLHVGLHPKRFLQRR
jgi:hypothetical protein